MKQKIKLGKMLTAVALLVMLGGPLRAQNELSSKLPIDPSVKIGRLSNGLTYYIRKNNKPEKKVELRLAINAGSILEDNDQQGLAHFIEHMAFNGSKNFKKNEMVSFLQSIGVEFGGDLNAYTSFDETVFILPIPTEKQENVEKGFQILQDWASTVAFEDIEINKERGVVLEESRLGKGANDRMFRAVYPKIFEGSLYADRLPIGREDILKTFSEGSLKRFYHDWYRPNLMAVLVVGDIEPSQAEALIKKNFDRLKNPSKQRPRIMRDVPSRTQSEAIVVTDKEATNHIVEIYYSYKEAKEEITIGDYRQSLVRSLLTTMLNQRLQEISQRPEPPLAYARAFFDGYARGYESFQSIAYAGKSGVRPAIEGLIQETERARKFGFTGSELERTKKMLLKSVERTYNERDKTESSRLVDEYVRNFLENEPIPGIETEFAYCNQFLAGITLEEINQYAAKNVPTITDPKLVVLTGPDKADFQLPTNQELLTMTNNAAETEIIAYTEKEIPSALMSTIPAPGKIIAEKENKQLGITEILLSNGVKVILKPTDFKNDQVVMNASRWGGQHSFDAKDRLNAEYASALVSQMGVGPFTPSDLRKVLAGKSASITPRLGPLSESISGQCSAVDVETMLQLTNLYFTQPRSDGELFKSFVSNQQAMYKNMSSDPQFTFQDSILNILYKDQPWAPKLPKAEMFANLNRQRALEMYKERFGDVGGFTFVLVGKFDLSIIKPLIMTYLGSLPASGKKFACKDVGLRPVSGPLKKEVKKGTEPKSQIRMFWNGEAPYSTSEQIRIQALAEVLNIKIIESLREEIGGIYGGSIYGSLTKNPYSNFSIGASLPCGPENVEKLINAALVEINKVKSNGPRVEDLEKVKETWRQQYAENLKDNSFWARQLIQYAELGSDPNEIISLEKRIATLTPENLKDAANRYLDMKNYVQIVLNPEN